MKNILLVIPSNTGTIASCFYNLYLALLSNKDVSLYVANMSYLPNGDFDFSVRTILSIDAGKCNYLTKIIKLKRIKHQYRIDVAISALASCNFLNIMSRSGEKTIGIFHAPLFQNKILGNLTYAFTYLSYKFLFGKFDKVFCVSESVKLDVLRNMKVDESKVSVVYNIHNISNIETKSLEMLDDRYKILFERKTLLYVGKLYSIKAPDRLLRAYAEIKRRDVHLASTINVLFIGKDVRNTMEKLNLIIDYYGIRDNVFFLGQQSNPYKFIRNADIVVSSSKSEGLPGVLIESLLLNTPIISSNSSLGVWEILGVMAMYNIHYKNNYYASKGVITTNEDLTDSLSNVVIGLDDKNMADAIMILLKNKKLYNTMKGSPFLFKKQVSPDISSKYII